MSQLLDQIYDQLLESGKSSVAKSSKKTAATIRGRSDEERREKEEEGGRKGGRGLASLRVTARVVNFCGSDVSGTNDPDPPPGGWTVENLCKRPCPKSLQVSMHFFFNYTNTNLLNVFCKDIVYFK